jgi:two-component system CheB/CheR fusion protein
MAKKKQSTSKSTAATSKKVEVKKIVKKTISPVKPFPVVCFGASAGGLEAFSAVLEFLKPDLGMAYVLIMHLSPTHKSSLVEILRPKTKMKIHTAENGMEVQTNNIYVIPPNAYMSLVDGHLKVGPRSLVKLGNFAVDYFLVALASVYKNNSIGIILSGTASDGTIGLKAIKAEGGITFVQDDSAKFSGMPKSAYDSGYADSILSPKNIADELAQLAESPYTFVSEDRIEKKLEKGSKNEAEVLKKILLIVKEKTGIDFNQNYKSASVYRRVVRRSVLNKCKTLNDYHAILESKEKEVQDLYNDFLINVTKFFRDPEFYKTLETDILPATVRLRQATDPIRIWIAGCATGEEAYSVAITVMRFLEQKDLSIAFQVFASDLDAQAIAKARLGIYHVSTLQNVPEKVLSRYFKKVDGHFQIERNVREACVFSQQDLLKDPPFSRIDLISCQNVMIYLENDPQQKILQKFHYALKPSGFLFLGKSENIGASIDFFEPLDKKIRMFRRRSATTPPIEFNVPKIQTFDIKNVPRSDVAIASDIEKEISKVLLTRYVMPSVVVNQSFNITQFFGVTAPYLDPSMGRASFNVLKMIREDLLLDLRSLLYEAKKNQKIAYKEGIRTSHNKIEKEVAIEVFPKTVDNESFFLVVFRESGVTATQTSKDEKKPKTSSDQKDEVIIRLEEEMRQSREVIRTTNEEYESTLEELQSYNEETLSSNEELQSVNEELETSKEELQSANEELTTINDELQKRNIELKESQNYSKAIVDTVNSPFLVLNANLQIRSANRSFFKTFKLNLEQTEGSFIYDLAEGTWDIPILRESLNELLGSKKVFLEFSLTHYFPGVGELVFIVDAYRLVKEESKESLILLAFNNISDVLKANEELKLLNQHMAQFAYVASHDLQEPLRKIETFANYIAEHKAFDDYTKKYLDKISSTTTRMSTLLKDLLGYSILLTNKEKKFVKVDLEKTLQDVCKDLDLIIEEKNASINIDSLSEIFGDPLQINQLFYNLVINALKFSNAQPVINISIKNTSSEDRIKYGLKKDKRYVCVIVRDNGIGFDQKYVDKIFSIFQRLNDKPDVQGSGMGLAICKKIVEDHGGAISAISKEKEGATFLIFLPTP